MEEEWKVWRDGFAMAWLSVACGSAWGVGGGVGLDWIRLCGWKGAWKERSKGL